MARQYLFNSVPTIHRKRNPFDLSHKHYTSMNVGDLCPVYCQEVLPGDDFKIDSAFISRLTSAYIRPVMDGLYLDQMFFFVPSRLVYDKFKNVMGESEGAWAPSKSYKVPEVADTLSTSTETFMASSNSVADYLGIAANTPLGSGGEDYRPTISLLPFRAFALIYNEWFRDENLQQPMLVQTGEAKASEKLNYSAWSPSNYTGRVPKVGKMHDYFTSALPAPQKGDPVGIPFGVKDAAVKAYENDFSNVGSVPVRIMSHNFGSSIEKVYSLGFKGSGAGGFTQGTLSASETEASGTYDPAWFTNLGVDMSQATIDVNDLRSATQLQRMLERDARGGTRYIEYIRSAFGVDAGDYKLQRPEFLGGKRVPLQVQQVPQTSTAGKDEDDFLGSLGAYSLSFGNARARKGFTEHGYIIGVACIRQKHTYQQGIEKFWTRVQRTDFYDPVFQSLGEQPVYTTEIFNGLYLDGGGKYEPKKTDIFGYQEAWADYRDRPNRVSGALRSSLNAGLDIWHFADDYGSAPVLNEAFIKETEANVNRALQVPHTSDETPQFIMEFDFKVFSVRCLPKFSVPGLLDHF